MGGTAVKKIRGSAASAEQIAGERDRLRVRDRSVNRFTKVRLRIGTSELRRLDRAVEQPRDFGSALGSGAVGVFGSLPRLRKRGGRTRTRRGACSPDLEGEPEDRS